MVQMALVLLLAMSVLGAQLGLVILASFPIGDDKLHGQLSAGHVHYYVTGGRRWTCISDH